MSNFIAVAGKAIAAAFVGYLVGYCFILVCFFAFVGLLVCLLLGAM